MGHHLQYGLFLLHHKCCSIPVVLSGGKGIKDMHTPTCMYIFIYIELEYIPLGLSRINRPEVVSHLRARSVSYRF